MRKEKLCKLLFGLFIICIDFQFSQAQLVRHSYRFNNTFSASEPDCGPDIIQEKALGNCNAGNVPGIFISDSLPLCLSRRTVYHTNLHWGLNYPNPYGNISTTYTIHMYVRNTDWGTKQSVRIIDFSSTANKDVGIYFEKNMFSPDYCLRFWPTGVVGTCPYFNYTDYYLLSLTRNGTTGTIDVYVNGSLFTSYNDNANDYVALPGNPIYIYRDDQNIPCESGQANFAYLSFTNRYSSQSEVSAVYNNICSIASVNTADFNFSSPATCSTNKNITVTYSGNIAAPGTGYSFNWNWDGGNVISGSGMGPFVVNWNTPGTKNVTLDITGGACVTPINKTLPIVVGDLKISASATSANCSSNTGVITTTSTGGSQPYQYSLDGLRYQSSNSFTVPSGQYNVIVKDANNCTANMGIQVPLVNDLVLQMRPDTLVCAGRSVTLSTTSNGVGFSWLPVTSLNDPRIKDPVATPTATTIYIVTATKGACIKKDSVKIISNPSLGISLYSTPADCLDNKGTIVVGGYMGTPPYQYSLDNFTYQSANTFRVFPATLVAYVKDINGCYNYAAVSVSKINSLELKTRKDTTVCQGQPVLLSTLSNGTNFSWQPTATLDNPNIKDPVANPGLSTSYTVTATLGACTKQDSVRVTVTLPVVISATTLPAYCSGDKGTITISASGGSQPYRYSLDNITFQSQNIFNTIAGTYSVYVKDVNNCAAFTSVNIPTTNSLTLQSRKDTSVCSGQPVKLLTVSNATSFQWLPTTALDNANIKDPVANPSSTTHYIVTATNGRCTIMDTVNITITQPVIITVTTVPANCSGSATGSITANANGGAPPYQYSLNGSDYQSQNRFTVAAGQYSIFVKDANNCIGNVAAMVEFVNDLVLQAPLDTSICRGQSVALTTSGNAANFSWQPQSGLDNPNIKNPVARPLVSTDYIVIATSGICIKKDTVSITVTQPIDVIVQADSVAFVGKAISLIAYSPQLINAPGTSYLWTPATGLNDQYISNPVAILKANQTYKVEVTSRLGCKGSTTVSIKVFSAPDIFVPTGFTPNNDGSNDILKPICIGIASIKFFKVFNRWGKLVYSSGIINQGWDGNLQGVRQPGGAYVWIVEATTILGQVIIKKGTFILIR